MNHVEKLKPEQLVEIEEIGIAFTSEVNYPGGFSTAAFVETWTPILEMGMGEVFVIRDGNRIAAALGCSFMKDGFNGRPMACESWWFAHKEYRGKELAIRLLGAFEAAAMVRGAKRIIMARLETPQAEKLDALYARLGYAPIEKVFGKEL